MIGKRHPPFSKTVRRKARSINVGWNRISQLKYQLSNHAIPRLHCPVCRVCTFSLVMYSAMPLIYPPVHTGNC